MENEIVSLLKMKKMKKKKNEDLVILIHGEDIRVRCSMLARSSALVPNKIYPFFLVFKLKG